MRLACYQTEMLHAGFVSRDRRVIAGQPDSGGAREPWRIMDESGPVPEEGDAIRPPPHVEGDAVRNLVLRHIIPAERAGTQSDDLQAQRAAERTNTRLRQLRSALAAVGLTLIAGCADRRVSIEVLMEMEREGAESTPIAVDPQQFSLTDYQPYQIAPGAVLSLTFSGLYGQGLISQQNVRVHDDGQIHLPLLGSLKVEGLDLAGVEKALLAAAIPSFVKDMGVFAELVTPHETTVMVMGAATTPGLIPLGGAQRNVLYALALAGGFNPGTSGRVRVRPIRPERSELIYDLTDINDLRRALSAPPLESGDMIVVEPAEQSVVYLTGLLAAPGPIAVAPGGTLSVVRAIAAAGGIRNFLHVKEATLWRKLADGRQVRAKLDLGKILAGDSDSPDFDLKPGDVLEIAHTPATMLEEWIVQNIRVGPFSLGVGYDPLAQRNANRALSRNNFGGSGLGQSIRNSLGSGIPQLLIPPVPVPAP